MATKRLVVATVLAIAAVVAGYVLVWHAHNATTAVKHAPLSPGSPLDWCVDDAGKGEVTLGYIAIQNLSDQALEFTGSSFEHMDGVNLLGVYVGPIAQRGYPGIGPAWNPHWPGEQPLVGFKIDAGPMEQAKYYVAYGLKRRPGVAVGHVGPLRLDYRTSSGAHYQYTTIGVGQLQGTPCQPAGGKTETAAVG